MPSKALSASGNPQLTLEERDVAAIGGWIPVMPITPKVRIADDSPGTRKKGA
jgi:hypothetical protein